MKPEFMRFRRAITLVLATLLASAGITLLSPAGAALAHHNTVSVSAACVNSSWTITWKITNSERDKPETIVKSNQAVVPVGTNIAAGGSFTVTERVSGPVSKTLTVVGHWPKSKFTDSPRSAQITPQDFKGACASPAAPRPPVPAPRPPVPAPTPPPAAATPQLSLVASTCVFDEAPMTEVRAQASGLPVGASYTVRLLSGSTVVGTEKGKAAAATIAAVFPELAPGEYRAELEATGSRKATSATVTAADCTPAPAPVRPAPPVRPSPPAPAPGAPVAVPTLAVAPMSCTTAGPSPAVPVSAQGLDSNKDYQVVLLDESAAPVASEPITDAASGDVVFEGLPAPASYSAVLQVTPGNAVVAGPVAIAGVEPCVAAVVGEVTPPQTQLPTLALEQRAVTQQLPTLATTGPGEYAALAAFAGLLLAAGGGIVTARLRRRSATA